MTTRTFWMCWTGFFTVWSVYWFTVAASHHNTGSMWIQGICGFIDALLFCYWWLYYPSISNW